MTKRCGPRPDQSQPLSALEVLMLATTEQAAAPTPEEGKRRAALRFFLDRYWEECPAAKSSLGDLVRSSPGSPNPFIHLSPAVETWLREHHLPVTADAAWSAILGANPFSQQQQAEIFRQGFFFPFVFSGQGWKPGVETPDEAAERIDRDFSVFLKAELAGWKQRNRAVGARAALSQVEREGLRLLALRQAHGFTFVELADRAKPLRRRWEPADGGKQLAETLTPEEARRKVQEAARLIGLSIRKAPTGRPRSPKTPK